jgi:endonuclease/exonuclease/phosphatase family metal-dependent hydrolase
MAEQQLRVVQLNAGSLLEPGWEERRHEVVAWLAELAPDVVCLQEVWQDDRTPNTAGWIVDRMPEAGWHWHFGGRPFDERVWPDRTLMFGSAVLSRWPIDGGEYHPLPVLPTGELFVAGVPWELLHVRTAGLDVFSCHLAAAPMDGRHRCRQVVALDEIIRTSVPAPVATPGRPREGMPAILCGDFNAEPDSDEIRFLTSLAALEDRTTFYQDAWRVAGDGGPGLTQDWRVNPIVAAMNVHPKRIDYVFVGDAFQRRGGAGRVLAARVAFDEPRTGVLASDHFGLVADILWPDRPPLP